MPKHISDEEIKHYETLSRIKLNKNERKKYSKYFLEAFALSNSLKEINTDRVKGLSHTTGSKNIFKADEVNESLKQKDAIANAKDKYNGYISTPRILK